MERFNLKKTLRVGGAITSIVLILGYGVWIGRDILFGISFSVDGIRDGMSTNEGILTYSGNARHANLLVVNGHTVSLAEDGTWEDTLALLPGENTIQIEVTDRFKRTSEKIYRIYYKVQ